MHCLGRVPAGSAVEGARITPYIDQGGAGDFSAAEIATSDVVYEISLDRA
jgi:hypothetical protein